MHTVKKFRYIKKHSKYNNKTIMYKNHKYDSKFEAKNAMELDYRVIAGELTHWDRQVKISLDVNGYHIANYFIDFVAYRTDGVTEYIEVKGFETDVWKIKWKLFEALMKEKKNVELIIIK